MNTYDDSIDSNDNMEDSNDNIEDNDEDSNDNIEDSNDNIEDSDDEYSNDNIEDSNDNIEYNDDNIEYNDEDSNNNIDNYNTQNIDVNIGNSNLEYLLHNAFNNNITLPNLERNSIIPVENLKPVPEPESKIFGEYDSNNKGILILDLDNDNSLVYIKNKIEITYERIYNDLYKLKDNLINHDTINKDNLDIDTVLKVLYKIYLNSLLIPINKGKIIKNNIKIKTLDTPLLILNKKILISDGIFTSSWTNNLISNIFQNVTNQNPYLSNNSLSRQTRQTRQTNQTSSIFLNNLSQNNNLLQNNYLDSNTELDSNSVLDSNTESDSNIGLSSNTELDSNIESDSNTELDTNTELDSNIELDTITRTSNNLILNTNNLINNLINTEINFQNDSNIINTQTYLPNEINNELNNYLYQFADNLNVEYNDRYKEQIEQMENMGFNDRSKSLQALIVCDGNLELAVNYYLQN